MPTAFVCERCDTEVAAGLLACPRCGQAFDTPVPDAATYGAGVYEDTSGSPPAPALTPGITPDPTPVPFPKMPRGDRSGLSVSLFLALIVLACLFWLAHNGAFQPGGGYLPPSAHPLGH